MKKLVLAYHSAQQALAQKIDADLSKAGYAVIHLNEQQLGKEDSLAAALAQVDGPVVLLLSDNLLKSAAGVEGLYAAIDALQKEGRVLVVVVPGTDDKGLPVATEFHKVSDIIKYMNYWQERYLQLRREKRQVPPGDLARAQAIQQEVQRVKRVAGEIGELLHFVRAQPKLDRETFFDNHYEHLFKWLGDPTGHVVLLTEADKQSTQAESSQEVEAEKEKAKPHPRTSPPDIPSSEELVQIIQNSEAELMAELHGTTTDEPSDEEVQYPKGEKTSRAVPPEASPVPPADADAANQNAKKKDEKEEEEDEESGSEGDIEIIRVEPAAVPPFPSQDELERLFEIEEDEEDETNPDTDMPSKKTPPRSKREDPTAAHSQTSPSSERQERSAADARTNNPNDAKQRAYSQQVADEGLELIRAGKVKEALAHFEKALEAQPDNIFLRYEYAFFLAKYAHDMAGATQALEEVRRRDPEFEDAWFLLGELAETHGDYHLARNYYEKVLELDPDYPGLHYHMGVLLFNHFLPEEAKRAARHLKKALKHYKKNADAHYRLAILYHEHLGRPEKAIKHYKKALKYEPHHPLAAYDLAVLYHRQEAWELARHYYLLACEINPEVKTPENDRAFGLTTDTHGFPESDQVLTYPFEREAPAPQAEENRPTESTEPEQLQVQGEAHPTATKDETAEDRVADSTEKSTKRKTTVRASSRRPIALITGATSGIGRATAARLAEAGYDLIITGRRKERLEALAQQWRNQHGVRVLTLCFDLRDRQAVAQHLGQLPREWAQVDVLVNNAGLARGLAPIHEGDPDDWDAMIDTNIKGLLYVTRQIAPGMVARKKGHIVNVASTAGKEVYPNGNVYCATKHAVDALTKAMRLDLYKYRIRVSQVAPAHVEETEFALVRFKGDAEKARIYEDFQPLKASDVANAIYYIVSQPPHVNVQDVLLLGTQQASSIFIDRSGRDWIEAEEEE